MSGSGSGDDNKRTGSFDSLDSDKFPSSPKLLVHKDWAGFQTNAELNADPNDNMLPSDRLMMLYEKALIHKEDKDNFYTNEANCQGVVHIDSMPVGE